MPTNVCCGSSPSSSGERPRSATPSPWRRNRAAAGSPSRPCVGWARPTACPARSPGGCSGVATRVLERPQVRLDLFPEVLVVGWERELLAEGLDRLVHREARAEGGDLEEDAARLAEV